MSAETKVDCGGSARLDGVQPEKCCNYRLRMIHEPTCERAGSPDDTVRDPHHDGEMEWRWDGVKLWHKATYEANWTEVKRVSFTPARILAIAGLLRGSPNHGGNRTLLAALRHASWHADRRYRDHGRPLDKWDADLLERHADSLAGSPDDGDVLSREAYMQALWEVRSSKGVWTQEYVKPRDLLLAHDARLRQRLRDAEEPLNEALDNWRSACGRARAAEERERRLRGVLADLDYEIRLNGPFEIHEGDPFHDQIATALRGEETEDG